MLVDSEMGMPLDLNTYDGVWDGNDAGERSKRSKTKFTALNPILEPDRTLHPADISLLAPIDHHDRGTGMERTPAVSEVSWMRNSSLFMRRTGLRRRDMAETVFR